MERVVDSTTDSKIQSNPSKKLSGYNSEDKNEVPKNISNRLEMLSSAFDAIQKYLEEQSISPNTQLNNPPTSGLLLNQSFNR